MSNNNNNINFSLNNENNYVEFVNYDSIKVIELYTNIINEFVEKSIEIKNIDNYDFILVKGVETISYVFKFIILYTKNLKLTNHYSRKSIFYFIEFLQQINKNKIEFLNLSLSDAIVFVYNKTILH